MFSGSVGILCLSALTLLGAVSALDESVYFKFFKNGTHTFVAKGNSTERIEETGCTAEEEFAFLIHGWREACETEWMTGLIEKLTTYRGGCIVCVDYSQVAFGSYPSMMKHYTSLSTIIANKLKYFNAQGMDPNNVYMFGFSFGGQLAVGAGKTYGRNQIHEIDTCDMAGPGFDSRHSIIDHRDAAQNVQCIHTSSDKGTKVYACHQNWRMGYCGHQQVANPKASHQLCPRFYISAFENPFYAVVKSKRCRSKYPAPDWPDKFQMGYMETNKRFQTGHNPELFGEECNYRKIPNLEALKIKAADNSMSKKTDTEETIDGLLRGTQ